MTVREIALRDRGWVESIVAEHFASPRVVSRGRLYDARTLPGYVLELDGENRGLYQYDRADDELQVVVLAAVEPGRGVGRVLLEHAAAFAAESGCRRAWLVTTNNNKPAIDFYHHVGWHECAVHTNAVDAARRLKPEIPLTDAAGTPIRDEVEFELSLA